MNAVRHVPQLATARDDTVFCCDFLKCSTAGQAAATRDVTEGIETNVLLGRRRPSSES